MQGLLEPTRHMKRKKKLMMDGYMRGVMNKQNSSADLLKSFINFEDLNEKFDTKLIHRNQVH